MFLPTQGAKEKPGKGWDQELVIKYIYESFKNVTMAHDSYFVSKITS
jgi:hypothetical protein